MSIFFFVFNFVTLYEFPNKNNNNFNDDGFFLLHFDFLLIRNQISEEKKFYEFKFLFTYEYYYFSYYDK